MLSVIQNDSIFADSLDFKQVFSSKFFSHEKPPLYVGAITCTAVRQHKNIAPNLSLTAAAVRGLFIK